MERVKYTHSEGVKEKLRPKSIGNVIRVLKLILVKKVWRDWNLVFPEDVDDAFRQRMARVQGSFSREDSPNAPKFPDFPTTGTCHITCSRMKGLISVGEWLSLVEHLVRDQGVGGSNPLSPTNKLIPI